jgi:hypothetical protein
MMLGSHDDEKQSNNTYGNIAKPILLLTIGWPLCCIIDEGEVRFKLDYPPRDVHETKHIEKKYHNEVHAIQRVYKEEGIRGFFRARVMGLTFANTGIAVGATIAVEYILQQFESSHSYSKYLRFVHLSSAEFASYPLNVLVNRVVKSYADNQPHGIIDNYKIVKKQHGIKGFFRGFSITLLRNVIQSLGVQTLNASSSLVFAFELYESVVVRRDKTFEEIGRYLLQAFAGSLLISPLDLVQVRLQITDNTTYTGTIDCVKQIYHNEGIKGFYKGTFIYPILKLVTN